MTAGQALILTGGGLQVCGYGLGIVNLAHTRRRLAAQAVPFAGHTTTDYFRESTDAASTRPPTLLERVETLEDRLDEHDRGIRDEHERVAGELAKHDAAIAAHTRQPLRDLVARRRIEISSISLFAAGVTLNVIGALI